MDKNRQSIRLKNYDYSQNGLYFVTICIQHMGHVMGTVGVDPRVDQDNKTGAHMGAPLHKMVLNDVGNMIEKWWNKIPEKFPGVKLDEFQIMPNHLHGIIHIVGADPRVRPLDPRVRPVTLGNVVQWFKTMTTNEYINHVKNDKWIPFPIRLWQRNYGVYPERSRRKHIIRTENDLNKIREYIRINPQIWDRDRNNI